LTPRAAATFPIISQHGRTILTSSAHDEDARNGNFQATAFVWRRSPDRLRR